MYLYRIEYVYNVVSSTERYSFASYIEWHRVYTLWSGNARKIARLNMTNHLKSHPAAIGVNVAKL